MAAIVVRSLGHTVTILERNTAGDHQGQKSGIALRPDVQDFLSSRSKASLPYAPPVSNLRYLFRDGTEAVMPNANKLVTTSWNALVKALKDSLALVDAQARQGTSSYHYGSRVTDVADKGDKVEVQYRVSDRKATLSADMVIGADGISSTIRQLFLPHVQRPYAGYVLLRGIIPGPQLSDAARELVADCMNVAEGSNAFCVAYKIPSDVAGQQDVMWAGYAPCNDEELEELMTDAAGKRHLYTLTSDAIRPEQAEKFKRLAKHSLPSCISELIDQTRAPIVQVITDVLSPNNAFLDGKVLLMGEAMAGAR